MKLDLLIGYSGNKISIPFELINHAEELGFRAVWTAEAYGSDAISPAAWILARTERLKVGTAIMQMPGRTPAMAAMTAMTMSELSNGRFIVGLGASGPQVVEGWHGVAYNKPVTQVKEYVSIMRKIFAREAPVEFDGDLYQLPFTGPNATGLGKPLKSILEPTYDIEIYTASLTPAGVRASAEVADGFIPVWMDPSQYGVFESDIQAGQANTASMHRKSFQVTPFVSVVMGNDVEECMLPLKGHLALYIGGMGSRKKNFYKDYVTRLGFGDAAEKIQEHYLAGRKDEAIKHVPNELVDACYLVGPKARIRERTKPWKDAFEKGHVSAMLIDFKQTEAMNLLADEFSMYRNARRE